MFTDTTALPTVEEANKGNAAPDFLIFRSLIDEFAEDAAKRKALADAEKKFGPVTGFDELDAILGGCLESGLHIVHGSPGAAKTAFALQIAAQCGCPALMVTTEMPKLELFRRHSARINETFLNRYKQGKMDPATVRREATKAAAAAPFLALLDATEAVAMPDHIESAAERLRSYAAENGNDSPHLLIVVDSVHSWCDTALESVPEYDRLNAGVHYLRRMAQRLKCSVIGVAERNRVAIKNKEEGAGQNSSAGSRKFEYSAESIIGLDSQGDEYDTGRGPSRDNPVYARTVVATISKNRHGVAGKKVELSFCGVFQEFSKEQFGKGGF